MTCFKVPTRNAIRYWKQTTTTVKIGAHLLVKFLDSDTKSLSPQNLKRYTTSREIIRYESLRSFCFFFVLTRVIINSIFSRTFYYSGIHFTLSSALLFRLITKSQAIHLYSEHGTFVFSEVFARERYFLFPLVVLLLSDHLMCYTLQW